MEAPLLLLVRLKAVGWPLSLAMIDLLFPSGMFIIVAGPFPEDWTDNYKELASFTQHLQKWHCACATRLMGTRVHH